MLRGVLFDIWSVQLGKVQTGTTVFINFLLRHYAIISDSASGFFLQQTNSRETSVSSSLRTLKFPFNSSYDLNYTLLKRNIISVAFISEFCLSLIVFSRFIFSHWIMTHFIINQLCSLQATRLLICEYDMFLCLYMFLYNSVAIKRLGFEWVGGRMRKPAGRIGSDELVTRLSQSV